MPSPRNVGLFKAAALTGLLVCSFIGSIRCAASDPQSQAPVLESDGDDDRDELLYHWQDKRFSDEEQRQIVACTIFVGLMIGGGAAERRWKRKRSLR